MNEPGENLESQNKNLLLELDPNMTADLGDWVFLAKGGEDMQEVQL